MLEKPTKEIMLAIIATKKLAKKSQAWKKAKNKAIFDCEHIFLLIELTSVSQLL